MNFDPLINTLETELCIYKDFEKIEEEKTGVITAGDIEKLDNILNTEHMLHMKLQDIEKKRIEAMRVLGLYGKTLSGVIELANGKDKNKLSEILEDLNICIDALKSINEKNTKLVKARLEVITSVKKLFNEPGIGSVGSKGSKNDGSEKIYGKNAKVLDSSNELEPSVIHKKI